MRYSHNTRFSPARSCPSRMCHLISREFLSAGKSQSAYVGYHIGTCTHDMCLRPDVVGTNAILFAVVPISRPLKLARLDTITVS